MFTNYFFVLANPIFIFSGRYYPTLQRKILIGYFFKFIPGLYSPFIFHSAITAFDIYIYIFYLKISAYVDQL